MSSMTTTVKAEPTPYESDQIQRIAEWKSTPPNPFAELFKTIALPGANLVEKVIPDRLVSAAIEKTYRISEWLAGQEDIKRQAGVENLHELKNRPLEECDRLALRVSVAAQTLGILEGAATGAGGVFTTLVDVPLLFALSLRTILRIGHCYGYALEHEKHEGFVLGVLVAAASGSLATKRERLDRLREVKHILVEETREEILADEVLSVLFQLEIFEEVPGIGLISGALLNFAFIRRVDITARRVFQERWLQHNGKVDVIDPAPVHERHLAPGWRGALGRVAYSGCYSVGFGAALPVCLVASFFRSSDEALAHRLSGLVT